MAYLNMYKYKRYFGSLHPLDRKMFSVLMIRFTRFSAISSYIHMFTAAVFPTTMEKSLKVTNFVLILHAFFLKAIICVLFMIKCVKNI